MTLEGIIAILVEAPELLMDAERIGKLGPHLDTLDTAIKFARAQQASKPPEDLPPEPGLELVDPVGDGATVETGGDQVGGTDGDAGDDGGSGSET